VIAGVIVVIAGLIAGVIAEAIALIAEAIAKLIQCLCLTVWCFTMYYRTLASTGCHISKYDDDGLETDFHPTDLVENEDCEICEDCGGQGCELCDFQGYIDWSEPNGVN
jgi:hypothetical protein